MGNVRNIALEQRIFGLSDSLEDFESLALDVFRFQLEHNAVYREFCMLQRFTQPRSAKEIPFLPISFFKSHRVMCSDQQEELLFLSSGTTGQARSKHTVLAAEMYETSFLSTYKRFLGNPEHQTILALLPNYLEQGQSSLVYMVDTLIQKSQHSNSGFFLNNYRELVDVIAAEKARGNQVVLFGVAYALLDLAELKPDLSGVTVIETGGMKGRRKELTKEELHNQLKQAFQIQQVYSEYGMTELLSQAYSLRDQWFTTPNWMKIWIREVNDPKSFLVDNRSGGINVIDLANLYSCSFIATDDLGVTEGNFFRVLGRIDNSDIRGCNLLVNS
jgi:hypothetical protein